MREVRCDKFIELLEESKRFEAPTLNVLVSKFNQDHSGLMLEIIEKGYARAQDVGELWARANGTTFVNPLSMRINVEEEKRIPLEMAKRIKAIGLYEFKGFLTVAMDDPTNRQLVESLERFLQLRISPVFALTEDIERAIDLHYNTELSFDEALKELESYAAIQSLAKDDREALNRLVEANALVDITNRIFLAAFKRRASDIHIEPQKRFSRIRLRVDGRLRELVVVPKNIHQALLVRIKFISELDIADTLMPQDGRFTLEVGSFQQDFRISTCPGIHGEKAVLRVLGQAGRRGLPTFDELLFSKPNLLRFRDTLANPNGIFIVTGPTGSGKTTTLYSALDYLNDNERNIMTIENPVEYQLPGVNHFEVSYKRGLNFATILRSALRQDPDIILVGEVRDAETAAIATEAALTGHLVLTTLHTNSALQAVLRLVEIGVEPHMVAPALNGVLSQRLVGRICEHCKEAYQPKHEILAQYFTKESLDYPASFYRGRGCPQCNKTGFNGRIAIHELVEVSEEMRELIAQSAPLSAIEREARRIGFKSLREDGLKKALLGFTTLEEIERVSNPEYAS